MRRFFFLNHAEQVLGSSERYNNLPILVLSKQMFSNFQMVYENRAWLAGDCP
jgi:hypothetical protein